MLSHSVAEISAEEEAKILHALCSESRVVLNKNGTTKASSSTKISATERLSNSNSWSFRDHINAFKMSPITWNSIQDHRRFRPSNFHVVQSYVMLCPKVLVLYIKKPSNSAKCSLAECPHKCLFRPNIRRPNVRRPNVPNPLERLESISFCHKIKAIRASKWDCEILKCLLVFRAFWHLYTSGGKVL